MERRVGFAIIFALGVLSVLSMIALAFAFTSLRETYISHNYAYSIKAKFAAEAGLARTIAELKSETLANFQDALNETWASGYSGTVGNNTYNVTVIDEARKVNINNANAQLLDNLPGITPELAANVVSYRTTSVFATPEEIKFVTGITAAIYAGISDLITTSSYSDPHCAGRSPINVNTADFTVLQAVFEGISGGGNTISTGEAIALATHIAGDRSSSPMTAWADFSASIDDAVSDGHISSGEAAIIKENCNPNRVKPSSTLTAYTTEFCYNSGGVYSLLSTGASTRAGVQVGAVQKRMITKIFDMWVQTDKAEFMVPWLNDEMEEVDLADGDLIFVTWMDSCPVNSTQSWDTTGYDTVPNSLKLGFWDNFEEYIMVWPDTYGDRINDWSAWYWGSGGLNVSGGVLNVSGGWTQSNLDYQYPGRFPTVNNTNRWNMGGLTCTISMRCPNIFYWRRWINSNNDTRIYVEGDPSGSGNTRLTIMSPSGYEYGSYSFPGSPTRITIRLNGNNTVAAAFMSNGTIGGTQSIGSSNMSNSGQVIGAYQAWVDNVRVIPAKRGTNTWNGRYISAPFNLTGSVRLGNISGTVTIPASANAASETVTYGFCPDGSLDVNGDGTPDAAISSGDMTNVFQYVVYFSSNNATLYETPVLEDITITYIRDTVNLYYR
ncbi:MAG: helix-hairpin-helix domain-containing protein [Candidatus Omnitrophota bacterium]